MYLLTFNKHYSPPRPLPITPSMYAKQAQTLFPPRTSSMAAVTQQSIPSTICPGIQCCTTVYPPEKV